MGTGGGLTAAKSRHLSPSIRYCLMRIMRVIHGARFEMFKLAEQCSATEV